MCLSKTEIVRQKYEQGDFVSALRICKDFRIGVSEEHRRNLQIAYECLTGNEKFYKSIGIDTKSVIERSKDIIKSLFFCNHSV